MTRVKICGITNLSDALAACEFGADALGFVFAPEAKKRGRYVKPENAREIIEQLPPFVATIAVCVNDPPERLREYLKIVDYVQLHGEETIQTCGYVAHNAVKAFRLGGPDGELSLKTMAMFNVRAYLLDAYVPDTRGGTGRTCDWDLAARLVEQSPKPVILAGGLVADNVAEAVRQVNPYCVDVSGGVENAPGKKDHEQLRRFITNAKLPVS